MWPRHVVILMSAAAAPLGEYGLEDPTAASGVQPIVQFLMAGEGNQKRGEAHFVVRRLRAVRPLADDDFVAVTVAAIAVLVRAYTLVADA